MAVISERTQETEDAQRTRVGLLQAMMNLSRYHNEHEKYYSGAPLYQAIEIQKASKILKTLAERWSDVSEEAEISGEKHRIHYSGCDDLNVTATIQHTGVLFMEGEGEPQEIYQVKRNLHELAEDFAKTGDWLSTAIESTWTLGKQLLSIPELADLLGERHRIMINDWQAASMNSLASRIIIRALDILEKVNMTPEAIRENLSSHEKSYPSYLFSASELLDCVSDIVVESSMLVHDNDRKWREFRSRIADITRNSIEGGEKREN